MATLIIGLMVLGVALLAVRHLWKAKKEGRSCSSCGGGCRDCASSSLCHPKKER